MAPLPCTVYLDESPTTQHTHHKTTTHCHKTQNNKSKWAAKTRNATKIATPRLDFVD